MFGARRGKSFYFRMLSKEMFVDDRGKKRNESTCNWLNRISNLGPLAFESEALPTVLCGPAVDMDTHQCVS